MVMLNRPNALAVGLKTKTLVSKKAIKIYHIDNLQYFKVCDVIVVLVNRAQGMTRTAENKKVIEAYQAAAAAIAKQYNCDMSESQSDQPGQGGEGRGQDQAGDMQALADLATLQPFDANYIDFRQILAFVDRYAAWLVDQR